MSADEPGLVLPDIRPFGEAALLATWGDDVTLESVWRARALAAALDRVRARDRRWAVPIATAASVLAPFDALALDHAEAEAVLARLAAEVSGHGAGTDSGEPAEPAAILAPVMLPVRFGGADGPDLAAVARELGATPDEVVRRLLEARLEVLFLGFAPGFAYCGPLPDDLVVPRLATPRRRVPAGSVAIAGRFAGAYPAALPGGWRLLGRTDVRLFDPAADPPAMLRPGRLVQLVPA